MKKALIPIIIAMFLFPAAALAESLTLGDKTVTYEIPPGYVKAEGAVYENFIAVAKRAMPPGLQIRAMYVSRSAAAAFRAEEGRGALDDYLVITTLDALEGQRLTADDFAAFKQELKENYDLPAEARAIVDERLGDVFKGKVQISGMQVLGCFGESDTALSYALLLETAVDGDSLGLKQALVFSGVFVNEKLLFLNQYRFVTAEDEVTAFKDHSQTVLAEMRFAPGLPAGTAQPAAGEETEPAPAKKDNGGKIIFVVVAVILIVAGVVLKRKNAARRDDE